MQKKTIRIIICAGVFAVAMGFMEAAVVVYLREIYYPEGFRFPLQAIDPVIARIELLREAATIVMLLSFGVLAGRTVKERLAYFLFCFGVWDIFYYVFLKLLIGWPESLLTWDILFLVPTIWVGPVLAPCINSLVMIAVAVAIFYSAYWKRAVSFGPTVWSLFIAGALMILTSYLQGFVRYAAQQVKGTELVYALSVGKAAEFAGTFVPSRFNWPLFTAGFAMHIMAFILYCRRTLRRLAAAEDEGSVKES